MAALPVLAIQLPQTNPLLNGQIASAEQLQQLLEFPGVFKGHELTRKEGRLTCEISQIDALIGGLARGRISEITGPISSGKTTIAASFASAASRRGEVVGWVDVPGAFDPRSLEAAGADLERILWLCFKKQPTSRHGAFISKERERRNELKAAELLLEAGGFGLVVIDFGAMRFPLSQSASLRLARAAERSGTTVLALAGNRVCGTFAALTLSMSKLRASFTRMDTNAPALFDGLRLEASVERNKLGVFGDRAQLFAAVDQLSTEQPSSSLFSFHKPSVEKGRAPSYVILTQAGAAEGSRPCANHDALWRAALEQGVETSTGRDILNDRDPSAALRLLQDDIGKTVPLASKGKGPGVRPSRIKSLAVS
jgi:recA bacterial DNA recombination protein